MRIQDFCQVDVCPQNGKRALSLQGVASFPCVQSVLTHLICTVSPKYENTWSPGNSEVRSYLHAVAKNMWNDAVGLGPSVGGTNFSGMWPPTAAVAGTAFHSAIFGRPKRQKQHGSCHNLTEVSTCMAFSKHGSIIFNGFLQRSELAPWHKLFARGKKFDSKY